MNIRLFALRFLLRFAFVLMAIFLALKALGYEYNTWGLFIDWTLAGYFITLALEFSDGIGRKS